jgi:IclR family KDG regulon transcriptional repressor
MWPCAVANRGSVATDRETSIRRGIEVLLSLGCEEALKDGGMGVTRISEMLGREKSQVSRALKALAEYGLVERNRDALTYRLGWRIYALAQLAGEPRLLEEAGPRLRRLAVETQERAHFSVLQGTEVLTLLSESAGRAVEAVGWVGRVTPAYCTSAGAALLFDHDAAALELLFADVEFTRRARNTPEDVAALHARVAHGRERGVVLASDEFEGGLVAAAAPVRDGGGAIVGALNVSAPSFRVEGQEEDLCAAVLAAAGDLGRALAAVNDAPQVDAA